MSTDYVYHRVSYEALHELSADIAASCFPTFLFTFSRGFMVVAARMLLCFMGVSFFIWQWKWRELLSG